VDTCDGREGLGAPSEARSAYVAVPRHFENETLRRMFEEIIDEGELDAFDELFDSEFTSEAPRTLDRAGYR
jgi:rubrerythrin